MSDEGQGFNPLDAVEFANAIAAVAAAALTLYSELIEKELPEAKALYLTAAWLHGQAGGKFQA